MAPKKPTSDRVDLNDLASSFKTQTIDDFGERVHSSLDVYGYAYKQALKEGLSEADADEAAQKVEQDEADEAVFKYMDAVQAVAEKLYGEHGLMLDPVDRNSRHPFVFRVRPEVSWNDAANKIRQTINGVGMFHFHDLREFLSSGPYTAREAVLQHLHWIADHPRVYGNGTARSMIDRRLR
jgi:hypothetical protein